MFARDRDRSEEREAEVEARIEEGATRFAEVAIVGGVATEAIEAWVLELLGDRMAHQHSRPRTPLADDHGVEGLARVVEIIEGASRLPAGSPSSLGRRLQRLADATK